jgi:hypothetical protein
MSRSSASFSENFKIFSSLSEASAAFPNVNKIVPVVHYYPYGQAAPAATAVTTANKLKTAARLTNTENFPLTFPVQPAQDGMLWYSPFTEFPPDCQPAASSCSSSVACCGCIELDPRCDSCATCPIDYSDPLFPYFTQCQGDQITQIGPTYICVNKTTICTGELFTVTFNVINISGSSADWLPFNEPGGPDFYTILQIYAPGEPGADSSCLEIEYVTSNYTPFGIYPAFDSSNANGISPRGANILSVGWPLNLANGAEQTITAVFKLTGCCTCDSVTPPQLGDIAFVAEVIQGCNCATCYRCKPCDSAFTVISVPGWRSNVTNCPPEDCISIGGEWKSPFFDEPPSCDSGSAS